MIILFGGGAGFGLPDVSPYVTKTEIQLKMAGLAYRKVAATPDESPKGQIPFMDDDGTVVADSTFIRLHLERTRGIDFDEGLSARERGLAWAFERMVENQFGWTVARERWLHAANFEAGPAHFFDDAPAAIRDQLRAGVKSQVTESLRAVGVGRHSEAEILELADRSLAALSAQLGDSPYLMGERPCGLDATAFAMLAAALTPFFDGPVRRRTESYGNLVAYADRLMETFHPEHPWRAAAAMAA